jgi:hypothetical protein
MARAGSHVGTASPGTDRCRTGGHVGWQCGDVRNLRRGLSAEVRRCEWPSFGGVSKGRREEGGADVIIRESTASPPRNQYKDSELTSSYIL